MNRKDGFSIGIPPIVLRNIDSGCIFAGATEGEINGLTDTTLSDFLHRYNLDSKWVLETLDMPKFDMFDFISDSDDETHEFVNPLQGAETSDPVPEVCDDPVERSYKDYKSRDTFRMSANDIKTFQDQMLECQEFLIDTIGETSSCAANSYLEDSYIRAESRLVLARAYDYIHEITGKNVEWY